MILPEERSENQQFTVDAFLGGRLSVRQPVDGYRGAIDSVLLAAAIHAVSGGKVLDVGCGGGLVSLCLAARCPDLHIVGLEIQPEYADLARQNIHLNALNQTVDVICGDLSDPPAVIKQQQFDFVISNPPFFDQREQVRSRKRSRFGDIILCQEGRLTLEEWALKMLRRIGPKGGFALIHRAERLGEILSVLKTRLGRIMIVPIQPFQEAPAHRVIVLGWKGRKDPMVIHPAFVLHTQEQRYSIAAERVLKRGTSIPYIH